MSIMDYVLFLFVLNLSLWVICGVQIFRTFARHRQETDELLDVLEGKDKIIKLLESKLLTNKTGE